ncbi:Uncharacterised protein [Mycobacteroides abscessus]|nr:Uncharacterised protein [Mycobacteroides abscessus]
MSSTMSGTWPVARGSYVGGSTPRASYAAVNARSYVAAQAHQGSPASADFARILSSMSVTLRMSVTRAPPRRSQRMSTSNATAERMCPMWGAAWTVAPHR